MAEKVKKISPFQGMMDNIPVPAKKDEHTHNDVHTHTHTPVVKRTKDRRVQLLTYGELIDQMDAYGNQHGMSRAEVFEAAISEYLKNNT